MGANNSAGKAKMAHPDQDGLERLEKQHIRAYFDNSRAGVFVEVGANEPVSIYSQSWHLEKELGWHGLLIEPNPELAAKARLSRPLSTVCECACTSPDKVGDLELYIPLADSGEVTGHASLEINADDHHYQHHRLVGVRAVTLTDLLDRHGLNGIDLLSIDVEGTELDVLAGLDWRRYRPRLILLEDKHVFLNKHRYLRSQGYALVKRMNGNCWYVPAGAPRPLQSLKEKIRLLKRLYLSLWGRKLRYAVQHRTLKPFRQL